MGQIQDTLKKFMDNQNEKLASIGSFTVQDFNNLNKVINGTDDDFLIFDNRGGRKFDIVFDRILPDEKGKNKNYPVKGFIDHLLKEHKDWIYCYQLKGEQVVLRNFSY